MWTRRNFGKLLASVPAAALLNKSIVGSVLSAADRPNSLIGGVQVGTITYSYIDRRYSCCARLFVQSRRGDKR